MSKTPEHKVAEQLTNLTESHWFNSASMARYLIDQPFYTVDRVMELVAQIIHQAAKRHKDELTTDSGIYNSGFTSEGLFVANELQATLEFISKHYKWENLQLPKPLSEMVKQLPKAEVTESSRYSWVHHKYNGESANLNVQAVIM
jgi:hypothetical protein